MRAKVYINYKDGILDPQGATVNHSLNSMGYEGFEEIRIGKLIEIKFGNISKQIAEELTDKACREMLANPNTESYRFDILED
jgi:phosphoribosylformylglycinamidine synthase subunit PurS